MTEKKVSLTKQDRLKVMLRSQFLQGSWNYERMQNGGWAYAIIPALKKLYPNKEFPIWNEHLELYNTLEKNNFSKGNVVEMYLFLQGNFVINDYKKLINLNFLQQRDYNRPLS